ncbi:Calponin/transgelin [Spraguea lophii 42_110]|uniref:Calponin/transgelin n=1 Tax=Spraguea lophii (strain 42_110) TaxID=1358809 RepID=S7W689_SPRLO|nr:Calponin/transgelin [Spraguea lophii 42_110]
MPKEIEELKNWMEAILGEELTDPNFEENLRDGVVLCKFMNNIEPSSCKYKISKGPFIQRENISSFLSAARSMGVPEYELFQTIDLLEMSNFKQVIICLYSLSRQLQKNKKFGGPFIGPKLATQNKAVFSEEQLAEADASISGTMGEYKNFSNSFIGRDVRKNIYDEKENNSSMN